MIKRLFDITVALLGLVLLAPIFLLVSVLIKLDSSGPVFFLQQRMGRGFRVFRIYKFRTMIQGEKMERPLTIGDDPRITRVGRLLRKTKVDEMPQLINVLRGEMSLVGPRPELPRFVEIFREDYRRILEVPPGITDPASIKYRDESAILGRLENAEQEYVERILPDKIALAKEYVRRSTFSYDLLVILKTVLALLQLHSAEPSARFKPRRDYQGVRT